MLSSAIRTAKNRQLISRWLIGGFSVSLLIATSSSWQSWQNNTHLASITSLPIYFTAIWLSYLVWIFIAVLIFRWHKTIPMFDQEQPHWWLLHLGLGLLVGIGHLIVDTLLLWFSLSQSFNFMLGVNEKLIRWLPYELLAYWACLSVMTLITNRQKILDQDQEFYQRLSYKKFDQTKFIAVDEVDYIEAYDNYVFIWCNSERQLLKETMSKLEHKLNPTAFVRIHRSYIVNIKSVRKLINNQNRSASVELVDGQILPISRRRKASLKKILASP